MAYQKKKASSKTTKKDEKVKKTTKKSKSEKKVKKSSEQEDILVDAVSINDENFVSDVKNIKESSTANMDDAQEIESDEYLSPKKRELMDYYASVKENALENFGFEPIVSKSFECVMCHKSKPNSDFFRSYSLRDMGTLNDIGERHVPVCKRCSRKIFDYYYTQENNLFKTFDRWCQVLDIYFSKEIFDSMINLHNSRKGTQMEKKFDYVTDYITTLGRARLIGATYYDSVTVQESELLKIEVEDDDLFDNPENDKIYPEELEDWDQDDLDNYDYVLEVYHYDPFKSENLEDRRQSYYNLAGLSSEDIMDDFSKANAAIDMCRSMVRLGNLNKLRVQLESDPDPDIDSIKQVSALQSTERRTISQYSKEYGFNKRFALEQGGGSSTFTGIIKSMDTKMFEDSLINAYDIKTSQAMEVAAQASWKAIFEQLNISESEFSEIVKNQRETISELRAELDETKEKLRLLNIEIKKQELKDQLLEEEGDAK